MSALYIFAFATAVLSAEIIVYTTWSDHAFLGSVVRPFIMWLGIIPGFVSVCIGAFMVFSSTESSYGMAYLSAGLLLETGSVRLYQKAPKRRTGSRTDIAG